MTSQLFCAFLALAATVHVRARGEIVLDLFERTPEGLHLRGHLIDGGTRSGIDGHVVRIAVTGPRGFYEYAEPTRAGGLFDWRVPLQPGRYQMSIAASDGRFFVAPIAIERTLDLERRATQLTLDVPERLEPEEHLARIEVHAQALGDAPEPLDAAPVSLFVADKEIAREQTDEAGRARFVISRDQLGDAGARATVIARTRFAETDPRYDLSEARATIALIAATSLILDAPAQRLSSDEAFELTGLVAVEGAPLANAQVYLSPVVETDAPPLAETTSDERGRFTLTMPKATLARGEHRLRVRQASGALYAASSSAPFAVTVTAPSVGLALRLYFIPPLLIAALALSRSLGRRAYARLLRRRRLAARPPAPPSQILPTPPRPSLLRTLLAPADYVLGGQILDPGRNGWGVGPATPLPTALVTCIAPGGRIIELPVDHVGAFQLADVPRGSVELTVEAPGYVTERRRLVFPHRGECAALHIALVPLRARIFAEYAAVAASQDAPLPTPRELIRARAGRADAPWVADLAELVETTCYGAHVPYARDAEEATRLKAQILKARDEQRERRERR